MEGSYLPNRISQLVVDLTGLCSNQTSANDPLNLVDVYYMYIYIARYNNYL